MSSKVEEILEHAREAERKSLTDALKVRGGSVFFFSLFRFLALRSFSARFSSISLAWKYAPSTMLKSRPTVSPALDA